ncbi:hypothetical protein P7D15_02245 [Bacillus cereus]|uniref:hypothetical protein n=1 Tax=Bacillus cereus TaxID=1396 RepID=UPI00240549CB|nr:hypothetical protein [Bacillus cereus]MDF9599238.1 hypothetical protein [Bacillus cereus]MDG1589571.1 hypothetical protein [Bacillus cereus]
MSLIQKGMKVMPLVGFWKDFDGEVVNTFNNEDYPIEVEFEDGETNRYYEEQLEIRK